MADQYPWHIGPLNLNSVSVYIPYQDIIGNFDLKAGGSNGGKRNGKKKKSFYSFTGDAINNHTTIDFYEFLSRIPQSKIIEMQKSIEKLGWSLQYSLPAEEKLNRTDLETGTTKIIWSPPQPDSVDIILEKLFETVI